MDIEAITTSSEPLSNVGETEEFEAFLVGYEIDFTITTTPAYFFKLDRCSPELKCRWIMPLGLNDEFDPTATTFLQEAFKTGKKVKMLIKAIGTRGDPPEVLGRLGRIAITYQG